MSDPGQAFKTSPTNPAIEGPVASGGSPPHHRHPHEWAEHNHPISIEAQMRLATAIIGGISTVED